MTEHEKWAFCEELTRRMGPPAQDPKRPKPKTDIPKPPTYRNKQCAVSIPAGSIKPEDKETYANMSAAEKKALRRNCWVLRTTKLFGEQKNK